MTPRDFLAQRIPGPYTCLRARGRALLGFDFHLARLLHSIRSVLVPFFLTKALCRVCIYDILTAVLNE